MIVIIVISMVMTGGWLIIVIPTSIGEISPPGPSRLRDRGYVKVLQQFGRRHPPRPYPPWIGQGGAMLYVVGSIWGLLPSGYD